MPEPCDPRTRNAATRRALTATCLACLALPASSQATPVSVTAKKSPRSTASLRSTKNKLIQSPQTKIVYPKCGGGLVCTQWLVGGAYDPLPRSGILNFGRTKLPSKDRTRILFVAGSRTVSTKKLSVTLNGTTGYMSIVTGVFTGSNGSKHELTSGRLVRLRSCKSTRKAGETVAPISCNASIHPSGATMLRRKLKTKAFKRGLSLGKLVLNLRLQRRAVVKGQTDVALSHKFLAQAESAGITISPYQPAVVSAGGAAGAGPGRFTLPIKAGSTPFGVPAPALADDLPLDGALVLTAAGTSRALDRIALSPYGATATLVSAGAFPAATPPKHVMLGLPVNTTAPSQGVTSVYAGAYDVPMSPEFAAALNADFNTQAFSAGQSLGTFSPTAIVE